MGIILPVPLILIGLYRGWTWVRRRRWRQVHLGLMGLVLVEAVCQVTCPLTSFEVWLRGARAPGPYTQGWLAAWASRLLFHNWPPMVFTSLYALTAAIIAALYVLIRPD